MIAREELRETDGFPYPCIADASWLHFSCENLGDSLLTISLITAIPIDYASSADNRVFPDLEEIARNAHGRR